MKIPGSPYLLLVLTTLFWSGNFVVGRAVHGSIPPVTFAFWRWVVALLILLPFARRHLVIQWPMLRTNWKKLLVCGVLGVGCFNTFIYIALQTTTATNALLINSTIPVMIVALSWTFGGTPLTGRQAIGVLTSLAGVITIICKGDLRMLLSLHVNSGDLWVLVAVCCWSVYTFLLRKKPAGIHPFCFLTAIMVFGIAMLTPFYIYEFYSGQQMLCSLTNMASVLYVGVFASLLAFILWSQSVDQIGANKAGLFLHLMPVFGTVLSIIFLNESFYLFHLTGIAMIFIGIYLTTVVTTVDRIRSAQH